MEQVSAADTDWSAIAANGSSYVRRVGEFHCDHEGDVLEDVEDNEPKENHDDRCRSVNCETP